MPIVLRTKSLRFDLKGPECETNALESLMMHKLRRYEGTNMDKGHVVRITKILNISDRRSNPRFMYGEMTVSVLFEYEAEVLQLGLLHNATIVQIDEIDSDVMATCSLNGHTTANIIIDKAGVVTKGMTVPIRALQIEYPQTVMNVITIQGELLKPTPMMTRSFLVDAPEDKDVDLAIAQLAEFEATVARISAMARAQFFRAWLYPYRQTSNKLANLTSYINKKPPKKSMYVRLDDTCDASGLQFAIISRAKIIDRISWPRFVEAIIADGVAIWQDIEQLCKTYEADAVFNGHRSVWAYYEDAKLTEKRPDKSDKKGGDELGDPAIVNPDDIAT